MQRGPVSSLVVPSRFLSDADLECLDRRALQELAVRQCRVGDDQALSETLHSLPGVVHMHAVSHSSCSHVVDKARKQRTLHGLTVRCRRRRRCERLGSHGDGNS